MGMARFSSRRWVLALAGAAAMAVPAPALAAATVTPEDMTMGRANAPVTLIVYASASCPHCADFNNAVFPAFKKKYIDTGQVRYVFREYLTDPAQVAAAGFIVARCAGPNHYFQILDAFFQRQARMYQTGDVPGALEEAGAVAGLSKARVRACVADVNAIDAVNLRSAINGTENGVSWTPTFDINGSRLRPTDHGVGLADLEAAIEPLLSARGRR
jgi:protein-disulfide isomerase